MYAEGSQCLIKIKTEKSLQEIKYDEENYNVKYILNDRAYNKPYKKINNDDGNKCCYKR
jgi:hypothetical protein